MTRSPVYQVAVWTGYGNGRSRWAVYCKASRVFYFPEQYGQRAAERLARRMNASAESDS